ncbi:MAG: AAA family ATPase [Candidatus Nitrosocaldus sp.]|nr:AAA family ATPase [Candidatus Nitrosocaldus sp.]MDW7999444.1 AAA family ATPase [Candidatus Nitrosocaldus sp.]
MQLTRLYVKNFGPIKEACVELGDLTIITGAQNSGKSYLATLLYALSSELTDWSYSLPSLLLQEIIEPGIYDANKLQRVKREKRDSLREVFEVKYKNFITPDLIQHIIKRAFAREIKEIIREGSQSMEIGMRDNKVRYQVKIERSIDSLNYSSLFKVDVDYIISKWINNIDTFVVYPDKKGSSTTYKHAYPSTLFIPVERLLILSLFPYTISYMLEYLTRFGDILSIKAHISSYLQILQNILSTTFQYELLNLGSISIESNAPLPITVIRFHDKQRGITVPLHTAASGIIQLAGIVLPLTRIINPRLIIIEEPEVNLHADMHITVADYLAEKVAEGRRMVITTHSEYLLARLAQLYAQGRIGDMKAYYIDRRDRVRRLAIDKERGEIELPEGIRDAIDTLAKDAMRLIKV